MLNLLILEKDPQVQSLLTDCLSERYSVEIFSSASRLKKAIEAQHCDLIVFDLPSGTEPFKLLNHIKTGLPFTPIIATSRAEKPEVVVKTMKEGAFDFISKPYSPQRSTMPLRKPWRREV